MSRNKSLTKTEKPKNQDYALMFHSFSKILSVSFNYPDHLFQLCFSVKRPVEFRKQLNEIHQDYVSAIL